MRDFLTSPKRLILVVIIFVAAIAHRASADPRPVVNVNTATVAELVLLPGVGPKLARAILDARAAGGKFTKVEDLLEVKGIGLKNLAKMRPFVVVSGETTAKAKIHVPKVTKVVRPGPAPKPAGTRCGPGARCGGAK